MLRMLGRGFASLQDHISTQSLRRLEECRARHAKLTESLLRVMELESRAAQGAPGESPEAAESGLNREELSSLDVCLLVFWLQECGVLPASTSQTPPLDVAKDQNAVVEPRQEHRVRPDQEAGSRRAREGLRSRIPGVGGLARRQRRRIEEHREGSRNDH